ncbi:MAG TPA: outer membrane protein assembly factor BamC, partial [Burkholderiales bacterium]|nr:outer membrane protein assembly factor BamC [Burkholderiales bacterium]
MKSTAIKLLVCLLACASLGSCSWLENKRKVDYKNTRQLPPLEVPPELRTTPDSATPATASPPRTNYSDVVGDKQTPSGSVPVVLAQVPGVSLERDGQTRWLLVQAGPEGLYPYVRQFVTSNGLAIDRESSATGVIETDWLETQAKSNAGNVAPPAKWLSRFPPTTTRDKFRIRLERGTQPGTTEIYIAHYGVEDTGRTSGGSRWQPRAPEPGVEAEMLRLLIAYLGKTDVQARSIVAQATAASVERAQLWRRGDSFMLSLEDSLDRAWRRVGLSLDRVGFTVEDRDRSKGIYYVRYLDPEKQSADPGWFSRLFGADAKKSEERYQIRVQSAGDRTQV